MRDTEGTQKGVRQHIDRREAGGRQGDRANRESEIEGEKESEIERETEGETERDRNSVSECVCV